MTESVLKINPNTRLVEVDPDDKNATTDNFKGRGWPEPKPIQAALHPVPAFDPDTLLPEALRGWIMDEADRMPCPPDFIAAGALVALGAIVGARCTIKPKSRDSWLIVPNLWGGVVGLPSATGRGSGGAARSEAKGQGQDTRRYGRTPNVRVPVSETSRRDQGERSRQGHGRGTGAGSEVYQRYQGRRGE